MNNLHWLFAISAFVVISSNGKKWIWPFLTTFALLWAIVDFSGIAGWLLAPVLLFTILNIALTIFFENTSLEKHFMKIIVVAFILLSFVHTFMFSLELF